MFDNASRLVISYVRGSKDIAGFSVFRFDMEDTVEDDRQVTVVYWQVSPKDIHIWLIFECAATRYKLMQLTEAQGWACGSCAPLKRLVELTRCTKSCSPSLLVCTYRCALRINLT